MANAGRNRPVSLTMGAAVVLALAVSLNLYGFIMFGLAYPQYLQGPPLMHALLNIAVNAMVALWSLRVAGRLDRKIASVLSRITLMHGALAFAVLTLRLDYSNQVMLISVIVSTLLGLVVVLARDKLSQDRVALLGGFDDLPEPLPRNWVVVDSPDTDLRPYDPLLTASLADLDPEWSAAVSKAMLGGKTVRHLAEYLEEQQGLTSIEHFELDHMPVAGLTSYGARKRLMDVVLTMIALPVAIPLLMVGSLLVLVSMGRPVIFVQPRVGLAGKVFNIFKLRTMQSAGPRDLARTTVSGDQRITRVGQWLRRTRVDELPQLWNVLKGDMSLIGPRPEWSVLSQAYSELLPTYNYRHLVRPGITGWAQNLGGYASNLEETKTKLGYDLYYVKNISLGLDLQIILRTIWTIISGFGAR